MSQLPPGARAHIHLGAEGAAVSEDQRSLPRTLFAALCATLILIAAPLAWASTALGADQGSSPVATLSKSGAGGSDHEDDGDDDDTTGDDTRSGTGSKGTERTGDGTGRNVTTAGGAGDDSNTTTSNSAGTTQTRTTTGKKKKRAVNQTTRGGANDDTNTTTDNTRGTTRTRTTTGS
jgi:hypothetical protein